MAVSLVLLGGTLVVYSGTRKSYSTVEQLSRVQENGRFALEQIVRDIREAGYSGCAKEIKYWTSTLNNTSDLPWNFANPVQGYEGVSAGSWAPALDASLAGSAPPTALAGQNDVLVVRLPKRDAVPTPIAANLADGTSDISAPSSPLAVGDVAMISNCEAQSFFQITGVTGGLLEHDASGTAPGNSSGDLGFAFEQWSELIPVVTHTYYLAPPSSGSAATRSLWRKVGNNTPEELVEGVDGLQFLFGVDTTGDQQVDSYVKASSTINWAQVMSVRVALLVHSVEEYGPDIDKQTYTLLDSSAGSFNDRRLRQVFTSTVTLRNRAL